METSSVVFTNFNQMDYSDLSVKIRSSSGPVFDAESRIESCEDVLMWFRTIERLSFCVGTGMDTEKRDVHCIGMLEEHEEYVRTPKSARCLHCRSLKKRLQSKPRRKLVPKLTAVKAAAKSARRKYLRLRRKNEKLLADVSELHRQCAESKANYVDEAISTLPEKQREAVLACLAASKVASNGGHRYTIQWIHECLLMRIRSSRLYDHVRDRKILPLLSKKTLSRCIQKISSSTYGFQQAIFECLRKKGSRMDSASKRGSLSINEMKLSEGISFDRRTLKFGGFVDLGEYTPETQKTSRADPALVFMFQPFRGTWVQVLGCFLTKASVPGSVLHKLMLECVILLSNSGFHVDAVTTDGARWNRAVWKLLNISEENVSTPHPCDESRRLSMISDFPHLIKCIRTAIMRLESFPTPDGVVKKDHWKALLRCENFSKPNWKVAYKLTPQHINPKGYQVMNVPLAFELFSHPVRAAMQIYEKTEPALADSASTRAFTERIDNVITAMTARASASALRPSEHCQNKKLSTLDILPLFLVSSHHWNLGRQTFFSGFAVQSSDEMIDLVYLQLIEVTRGCLSRYSWNHFRYEHPTASFLKPKQAIESFLAYLKQWESSIGMKKIPISQGTWTGLKVTLRAPLEIVEMLQKESNYEYLLTARLNQDALERFFGMMRSAGGSNEHPDPQFFAQVFWLLCSYSLVKPPRGSNVDGCELLETLMQTPDSLSASKKPRAEWLKSIDVMLEGAGGEEDATESSQHDHDYDTSSSLHFSSWNNGSQDHTYDVAQTSKEVQSYMAGYVARKMMEKLKCLDCKKALIGDDTEEEWNEVIKVLEKYGGAIRPSCALFRLTEVLEKAVLDVLGKNGVRIDTVHQILRRIGEVHRKPIVGCDEHGLQTTNTIIDFYVIMRSNFITKSFNRNQNEKRMKSKNQRKNSKLI